jgi:DNA-binding beta-propeller fold protein YncE
MLSKPIPATLAVAAAIVASITCGAQAQDPQKFYQLQTVVKLGGSGTSWDHIDYDQTKKLVYLSRRDDGLTVVDGKTGKVVANVANAKGTGSVALAPKLDRGFTANTDGSTSVFKLSDFSAVDRISFGDNFDGVVYDEGTNILAYQQADNSKELLVDAATMKLAATIQVEGDQLERPTLDGKGNLYLPLRDKSTVYKIDLRAKKIVAHWDVSEKCTEPSGADYDPATDRLFLGCRGKQMTPQLVVVDGASGKIVASAPIGRGVDDVIFDPATKLIYTANGLDANVVVYKQDDGDKYSLSEAFSTRAGMRVMRLDTETKRIYGMTADYTVDPSKKNLAAISPFYPNKIFPDTFVMLTYGRGTPVK